MTVTVVSRQAQMTALKAKVQQLRDTGVISSKQGRTLQGHLKFEKNVNQTVKSLTKFQTEVRKLINSRTLSNTTGQILISDAENLIRSVSIFVTRGHDRDNDCERDGDDD